MNPKAHISGPRTGLYRALGDSLLGFWYKLSRLSGGSGRNPAEDHDARHAGALMPHSAKAIANEFLRRRGSDAWPQQMLIQKLVHIANGWNLAINGAPLVGEPAEAWDNGPVFRSIWDHIRDWGYGGPNCTLTNPASKAVIQEEISPQEQAVIDHVWRKYGNTSPYRLSAMTHEPDTPWYKAYFGLGRGRNSLLDNEEIKQHYIDLAMAGRAERQAG